MFLVSYHSLLRWWCTSLHCSTQCLWLPWPGPPKASLATTRAKEFLEKSSSGWYLSASSKSSSQLLADTHVISGAISMKLSSKNKMTSFMKKRRNLHCWRSSTTKEHRFKVSISSRNQLAGSLQSNGTKTETTITTLATASYASEPPWSKPDTTKRAARSETLSVNQGIRMEWLTRACAQMCPSSPLQTSTTTHQQSLPPATTSRIRRGNVQWWWWASLQRAIRIPLLVPAHQEWPWLALKVASLSQQRSEVDPRSTFL